MLHEVIDATCKERKKEKKNVHKQVKQLLTCSVHFLECQWRRHLVRTHRFLAEGSHPVISTKTEKKIINVINNANAFVIGVVIVIVVIVIIIIIIIIIITNIINIVFIIINNIIIIVSTIIQIIIMIFFIVMVIIIAIAFIRIIASFHHNKHQLWFLTHTFNSFMFQEPTKTWQRRSGK
jgi:uncharacterized membrane protein